MVLFEKLIKLINSQMLNLYYNLAASLRRTYINSSFKKTFS